MNKKLGTALFLAVLLTALASISLVNKAMANPFIEYKQIPPPVYPSIVFLAPVENNTLFNSSKLAVRFNVELASTTSTCKISSIYYTASWQKDNITIYRASDNYDLSNTDPGISEYSGSLSLSNVPEGNQTLTITVNGHGSKISNMRYHYFLTSASSTVAFTVDTAAPSISVLDLKDKTFVEPDVYLNIGVSEPFAKLSYVLNGQKNVTIAGNTTLTGLSNGLHNVTVYAWDLAGNVGVSETVSFTVAVPQSTAVLPMPTSAPVVAASGTTVAIAALSLVYYYKKRRQPAS